MSWWKRALTLNKRTLLSGSPEEGWSGKVGASAVEIGRFTYGVRLPAIRHWGEGASLKVGAFCSVAGGLTVFLGGNHRVDWGTTYPFGHIFVGAFGGRDIVGHPQTNGDVVIGNDVWIGMNVTIMSGVTIGDGAVIAANSTVGKSVGPYEIWGGNPARLIRPRFQEAISRRLHSLRWWDCSQATIREMVSLLSMPPDEAILDRMEEIVARDPFRRREQKIGPV